MLNPDIQNSGIDVKAEFKNLFTNRTEFSISRIDNFLTEEKIELLEIISKEIEAGIEALQDILNITEEEYLYFEDYDKNKEILQSNLKYLQELKNKNIYNLFSDEENGLLDLFIINKYPKDKVERIMLYPNHPFLSVDMKYKNTQWIHFKDIMYKEIKKTYDLLQKGGKQQEVVRVLSKTKHIILDLLEMKKNLLKINETKGIGNPSIISNLEILAGEVEKLLEITEIGKNNIQKQVSQDIALENSDLGDLKKYGFLLKEYNDGVSLINSKGLKIYLDGIGNKFDKVFYDDDNIIFVSSFNIKIIKKEDLLKYKSISKSNCENICKINTSRYIMGNFKYVGYKEFYNLMKQLFFRMYYGELSNLMIQTNKINGCFILEGKIIPENRYKELLKSNFYKLNITKCDWIVFDNQGNIIKNLKGNNVSNIKDKGRNIPEVRCNGELYWLD